MRIVSLSWTWCLANSSASSRIILSVEESSPPLRLRLQLIAMAFSATACPLLSDMQTERSTGGLVPTCFQSGPGRSRLPEHVAALLGRDEARGHEQVVRKAVDVSEKARVERLVDRKRDCRP